MLRTSDDITTTAPSMLASVHDRIDPSLLGRMRVIRFGMDTVDTLAAHTFDINECKRTNGLEPARHTVLLGHSSSNGHQHHAILDHLNETGVVHDPRYQFVVHLAYGDPAYRESLVERIRSQGLPVVVDTRFRIGTELAKFRTAIDTFVNLLTTDQFSGSMTEHVMAGSHVITGSWLDYSLLTRFGVRMDVVAEVNALSRALGEHLDRPRPTGNELARNRSGTFELTSWESNLPRWLDFYIELEAKARIARQTGPFPTST